MYCEEKLPNWHREESRPGQVNCWEGGEPQVSGNSKPRLGRSKDRKNKKKKQQKGKRHRRGGKVLLDPNRN